MSIIDRSSGRTTPNQAEPPHRSRRETSSPTPDASDVSEASDEVSFLATPSPGKARNAFAKPIRFAVILALLVGAGYWLSRNTGNASDRFNQDTLLLHTVRKEPLNVTVIERGNLESQSTVPVLCEVDDYRRDGFNGAQIIWVIPNGSVVNKDDLLVELDEAPIREQMDEQILETEQARELMLLATAKLENQTSQNQTDLAEAGLQVKLADLTVKMFTDEENGTHRLEVESLKREIEDLNNEILAAEANLELKRNDKDGIESLFKLGYAGKSEFERSQLDFLQAESQYASKVNRLRTQLATLNRKETYEREMQLLELQGKLDTAHRSQAQVTKNNSALVTQLKASLEARKEQFNKEQELLERYEQQLKACKIYAPESGMVAYAVSRYSEVAAGQYFRLRQQILSLPNLKLMQVKTAVHESALDRVKAGQKVSIRVESFSDRQYTGTVDSVAVLPQTSGSSLGSDTRFYETIIKFDEEVDQLKPGMTAVVEIDVARVDEAITVPVQAVVSEKKRAYCYVQRDGGVERLPLELGIANDHQVQVLSGVEPGDQVILNPISLAASTKSSNDEEIKPKKNNDSQDDTPAAPSNSAPEQAKRAAGETADQ